LGTELLATELQRMRATATGPQAEQLLTDRPLPTTTGEDAFKEREYSMNVPMMVKLRQHFDAPRVDDIPATVQNQLAALQLEQQVRQGDQVAITAGSRGIAHIAEITKAIVTHFRDLGTVPFVVPAMGSHGGGTADGQQAILESYGITESYIGAEIRSSMETVIVDETPQGIPVHFDRNAYEADHVVVSGRVKPHTGFVGEIESGLHKMMLIGLGKHAGAKVYHRAIQDYSFLEIIRAVSDVVLEKCCVIAGVAIVENAYDDTGLIEAVAPNSFFKRETELLKVAKQWMPKLPFNEIDLLIVDEIGKNISGSGMDTNVIGRKYNDHGATEQDSVTCKRIFVRGLTPETHGNACGIGIAEFTNRRCAEVIDHESTRINCITGGHPSAGAVPLAFESDREAIESALQTVGLCEPQSARVVQIPDTLHLRDVLVSTAFLDEVQTRSDLELQSDPQEMSFDSAGQLADLNWSPSH